jgi:hypothetical protein
MCLRTRIRVVQIRACSRDEVAHPCAFKGAFDIFLSVASGQSIVNLTVRGTIRRWTVGLCRQIFPVRPDEPANIHHATIAAVVCTMCEERRKLLQLTARATSRQRRAFRKWLVVISTAWELNLRWYRFLPVPGPRQCRTSYEYFCRRSIQQRGRKCGSKRSGSCSQRRSIRCGRGGAFNRNTNRFGFCEHCWRDKRDFAHRHSCQSRRGAAQHST